jgi:adenylate cyclase
MNTQHVKRKLAAIVSTDVKGYSRLMEANEVETVRTLKACREVMTEKILEHQGRVVDAPGDNLLSEFNSVTNAVVCAVEIQKILKDRNKKLPEDRKMEFRIGINLGDVIKDGDRIYGDGINIAARIEGLAEGGGICISGSAYDQVKNKLPIGFEFLGKKTVKNIAEPIPVFRVLQEADAAGSLRYKEKKDDPRHRRRVRMVLVIIAVLLIAGGIISRVKGPHPEHPHGIIKKKLMSLRWPDKPSIAVLPFMNMSGDPEQEYFSDGLTEDLITDLSKISGLFVIARNSVFSYKGKNVKVDKISRELGVRYVLEGSVRKVEDRVRINAQLIDAKTGGHVWAERYDRDLKDIFTLQDEVRGKIVTALAVELTQDDQERMDSKGTRNLEAYDCYLRGLEYYANKMREGLNQAREMFQKAIELDPNYAKAYAALGHAYLTDWIFTSKGDRGMLDLAYANAQKAITINQSESSGHSVLGNVYLWNKQHDKAIAASEKAVALDPNNAMWIAGLGEQLVWAGSIDEGITYLKKALRLDPHYPAWYLFNLGHAYYLSGQYEDAVDTLKRALTRDPNFWPSHAYLAVSYKALGIQDQAVAEAKKLVNNKQTLPLEFWRQRLPYKDPAMTDAVMEQFKSLGIQ